jgi:hypothetical protein
MAILLINTTLSLVMAIYLYMVYILSWKYQLVSSYLRANKNMDKDEESIFITTYQYLCAQNRRY